MFPFFATGVDYTGGKFAAGVVDTSGNLPPASLTPDSIPLRPFRIFSKIRGDIRSSRFATGATTPVANGKNLQSEKV